MNQHQNGHRRGEYTDVRRKYILGGIAAVLIIIATIAAVFWIFHTDKNRSSADMQKQSASEQDTQLQHGEDENKQTQTSEQDNQDETAAGATDSAEARIEELMNSMTLEEKVCQLFMITPEALTGVGTVTQAGTSTQAAINQYPVGGLIYFSQNLQNPDQTRTMLSNTRR